MDHLTEQLKLKREIRELKKKNKQMEYDLSRAEYLIGETMIMLEQIEKRANSHADSFTALWCDDMLQTIRKTLDLPRFGVDLITWKQVKDTK
jgi:hypothetical protein